VPVIDRHAADLPVRVEPDDEHPRINRRRHDGHLPTVEPTGEVALEKYVDPTTGV